MVEKLKNSSCKYLKEFSLKDYVVIIPSVAVGNVAQLSCDLLISSLQMEKIATIWTPAVMPVLGYDPYDLFSGIISTSCELYASSSKKIAILQLRAPLVYKYAKQFLEDIIGHLKERSVKEVIILTSSFAHEKKYVMSSPFRYVANEHYSSKDQVQELQWLEHESTGPELKIYGGGFAPMLYDICSTEMPCLILYKYSSEGDNIQDAYEMVLHLSKVIPLFNLDKAIEAQLTQPVSWKLLFGRPPPVDIY